MFRLVGGKGGAGKTTCAAGLAMAAAAAGRRTLVISTDPAPSLGDALGQRLTSTPRRVAGRARLDALEIDSPRALERWLARRRGTLEEIALRGTWLDRADVRSLLDLALPGIDEIAALIELLTFTRRGIYDEVIVDTAPTGHTLRMLALPDTLAQVAGAFDHMQGKHRVMVEALRGGYVADDADALIQGLRQDAAALRDLLRDPDRTEVTIVSLPELMAIEETLDALVSLQRDDIYVGRIIVNRSTPPPPARCRWCEGRRTHEGAACLSLLRAVSRTASPRPRVTTLMARDREPIGLPALAVIGRELEREATPVTRATTPRLAKAVVAHVTSTVAVQGPIPLPTPRLLMFGGKGGVGKTTCAAAAAVELAGHSTGAPVLLVSTDPAHSLADVLGSPVSNDAAPLATGPPNLDVRELDPAGALRSFKDQYASAIDAAFDRLTSSSRFDVAHDRQIMHDLIDLSPPGLDEIAATLELIDLLEGEGTRSRYATIVVDTAPTGHALRLLEMPGMVHDWVKAMMGILLKYQPVTGLGDLGAGLLRLSRGLGRLRTLLRDPGSTQFFVVTRAAALPRAESVRLLGSLRKLGVSVPAVLVNATGSGTCARCRVEAGRERREIAALQKALPGRSRRPDIIVAPATVPPPHGVRTLAAWRNRWALHSERR
jgi:arsenite/tail-anchored protein-transporting ATPase